MVPITILVNYNFKFSLLQKVYIKAMPALYIFAIAPLKRNIIGIIMGLSEIPMGIKDRPWKIKVIISAFLEPIFFVI